MSQRGNNVCCLNTNFIEIFILILLMIGGINVRKDAGLQVSEHIARDILVGDSRWNIAISSQCKFRGRISDRSILQLFQEC